MKRIEINQKAKKIIKNRIKWREHVAECSRADICPKCGTSIIRFLERKGWFIFGEYYDVEKCTNVKCSWKTKAFHISCPC